MCPTWSGRTSKHRRLAQPKSKYCNARIGDLATSKALQTSDAVIAESQDLEL